MLSAEALSVAALVVSLASFATSAYFGFRDRARVIARSDYYPAWEDSPPRIQLSVVNAGRRPVILRMLVASETKKKWVGTHLGTPEKPLRLGEFERYERTIEREDLVELTPDGEIFANEFWFEDTLGKTHRVAGIKKNITKLVNGVA
jgi:hypothetical protein